MKNIHPPRDGISADVIWGKNLKQGREKGGKCKEKRRKGKKEERREKGRKAGKGKKGGKKEERQKKEEKGEKGKKKMENGSKRVK